MRLLADETRRLRLSAWLCTRKKQLADEQRKGFDENGHCLSSLESLRFIKSNSQNRAYRFPIEITIRLTSKTLNP